MKQNRIVIDNNVFISALLIKKSLPFQVVNVALNFAPLAPQIWGEYMIKVPQDWGM